MLRASRLPTVNPLARIVWEQLIAPPVLLRDRPDVLLCPLNVVPLLAPCPAVVTVHDLAFLRFDLHKSAKRRYLSVLTRLSVKRAAHVITVSEFTRREVLELLNVPPDKVTTIHNGRDERLQPQEPASIEAFRQQHDLPPRFLLFVGTLEPRKNLPTLLRAYAEVKDQLNLPLLIGGGKGWRYDEIFALVQQLGIEQHVRFLGFLPQDDLALYYAAATVVIYPSLYEGFGFPPLEAMSVGTPVITSNVSSLPEVVGNAALTVSPQDVTELANAILRLASDPALQAELRSRGLIQAQQFSWQRAASETIRVLRHVANQELRTKN
jgi:glycosyltransferase involved in cell wall biosynthesis